MPSLFYGAPHVDDAWAGVARLAAARERDQGHPLDAARAEIARLTSERDEARRALELTCNRNDMVTDLENALVAARAERDQARLELEATRAEVAKLTAPEALAEAYITAEHGLRMWGYMGTVAKAHFTLAMAKAIEWLRKRLKEQAEDRAAYRLERARACEGGS